MRNRKPSFSLLTAALVGGAAVLVACSADQQRSLAVEGRVGSLGIELQVAPGITLNGVAYAITGPASFSKTGSFNVTQTGKIAATISPIPAGQGYSITLSAIAVEGSASCTGSASFDVLAHLTTPVTVAVLCHEAPRSGSVLINGTANLCPLLDGVSATPGEVLIGGTIALMADAHDADAGPAPLSYHWSASSGVLSDANAQNPTFTCSVAGPATLTVSVSDGDPTAGCVDSAMATVQCTGSAGGSGGAGGSAGAATGGAGKAGTSGAGGSSGGAGGSSGSSSAGNAGVGGSSGSSSAGNSGTGGSSGSSGGASGAGAGGSTGGSLANLDIYRVGDGTSALVSSGNPVFVDEYTTDGGFLRTIAMPTAVNGANRRLVASGTATSEGQLTRSVDSHFVVVTGYDAPLPTASLAGTTGTAVPRIVGRIAADGTIDTSTEVMDGVSGNNPRSAVSTDGNQFWFAGAAGGVRFVTLGNTSGSTLQLSTTVTNLRQVNIFGSQLFASDSSGSAVRLGTVGSGLPMTAGQTIANLPGFPLTGSPYSFYFADLDVTVPGLDVLYVADDALGITKYALLSGSWVAKGTVGAATDSYRGLTAVVNAGTVTLYATRKGGSAATGGGELVSVVDASGYTGTFSATPTLLVTASSNTAFRGVAFAPVP
jgi:hypothetical protein